LNKKTHATIACALYFLVFRFVDNVIFIKSINEDTRFSSLTSLFNLLIIIFFLKEL
jgi:hypothetical protein